MKNHSEPGIYLTPIYGLEISKEIKGEFQIGRVQFFRREKASYLKRRFGIPIDFHKDNPFKKIFDSCKTFAMVYFKNSNSDTEKDGKRLVNEAIEILAYSQVVYCITPNEFGHIENTTHSTYSVLHKQPTCYSTSFQREGRMRGFTLDKKWEKFHKNFFFFKLCQLLSQNNEVKINPTWKKTINESVRIMGKASMSTDYKNGFLLNMIVLEMLLTKNQENYSKILPERIEAFIGWAEDWKTEKMHVKITSLYRKRCDIVHEGNFENVTELDYKSIKELNFILLWNIVVHINHFSSKEKIIVFSNKLRAEKILGLKGTVEPKSLKFMKTHTEKITSFEQMIEYLK